MFIKIYFDDAPLILADSSDPVVGSFSSFDQILTFCDPSDKEVEGIIELMAHGKTSTVLASSADFEGLKVRFFEKFEIIKAGGGLIRNGANDILMIFRRGRWDLPKGKLDEGETIDQCAIREVQEETGLLEVSILDKLTITYHTYRERNQFILKESHWFIMNYHGFETAIPQIEEQITEIRWVAITDMKRYFENTYPIIQEIIERFALKNTE